MPFESKAQWRKAFSGMFSKKRARRWADESPPYNALPEHVKTSVLHHAFEKLSSLIAMPKPAAPSLRAPSAPQPKPVTMARSAQQAQNNGRFGGMATSNSLKPPGVAASNQVVNPNKSLRSAMKPPTAIPKGS